MSDAAVDETVPAVEETLYGDLTIYSGTHSFTATADLPAAGLRRVDGAYGTPSGSLTRSVLAELKELYDAAKVPDWDGEGSLPVTGPTKEWGRKLGNSIPTSLPHPEVSIDRKGYVNFDWENNDDMVAAIVDGRGIVYHISFIDGNPSSGRINNFSNQFPRALLVLIQSMQSK